MAKRKKGGPKAKKTKAQELFLRALSSHRANKPDEAVKFYAKALTLESDMAGAWGNMGVALRVLKKWDAAVICQQRAVAFEPDAAAHRSNLGNVLRDIDRLDEALAAQRKAVELDPEYAGAWYNLALILQDLGEFDEAIDCYKKTAELDPENDKYLWDLALTYLMKGDFKRGFEAYESRWMLDDAKPHGLPEERHWQGEDLNGKTVLLLQEQGFGDAIQFIRYVPLLREAGAARVVVRAREPLHRLFAAVDGVDLVVADENKAGPWDVYCPLLSLPRIFKTDLKNIPAQIPFIPAPESKAIILPDRPKERKIGICWGGSPTHANDRRRSVSLKHFLRLCERKGAQFYSLQKGPLQAQLAQLATPIVIPDIGALLGDFADTAAVISQLDLLISVDTAPVHLAGALGKEVWVALPFAADWRWLHGRSDSPWYPTMRLFRQSSPGDWIGVFAALEEALEAFMEA